MNKALILQPINVGYDRHSVIDNLLISCNGLMEWLLTAQQKTMQNR